MVTSNTLLAINTLEGALFGKGRDLPSGEWEVPGALEDLGDDQLMMLAKEGRRSAFDTLVRRHQGPALEVARKQLGSLDMAKDAAQNTFVEIYRYVGRYRPEGKFKQLLYRILLNQCRMNFRSRRRTLDMKTRLQKMETPPAAQPDDRVIAREARRRVEAAMMQLSPKLREVMVLRFSSDLKYEEISQITSIPVGTVKSRLNQGVKKLKEIMKA